MRAPWIETAARHWQHRRLARCRRAERRPAMRDALAAAAGDCVLLAGNSHAEFLGTPDFGGRPCINLAVGGSTAADCAAHLAGLRAPVRVAASILIIGTNDIMRWRHPERARTQRRFEAEVRCILRILEACSPQVFVAALPPIGAWATGRDPASVAPFSARLEALCAEGGHSFFDPFAALRDAGPGLARTGLYRDGVHLADYTRLAAEVVRLVAIDPAPSGLRAAPRAAAAPLPTGSLRALHAAAWGVRP
ncbi:GDSL-type esterase/lipase family protein [Methylobacterium sp. NEAU K]|uniref:SGNH/GDSL hydrolase family protein n=1 Tax=Methylobacterium sp. NEAU K TaxID=3064946 RepID=UPI00273308B3|nr:GDSL-type esterase/lipase family protein [Methylobacterium sp. NEAU K]MDP4005411.1 GDSL-type esterase/lipase family protein [Methylobacterium sp. NEAU K]